MTFQRVHPAADSHHDHPVCQITDLLSYVCLQDGLRDSVGSQDPSLPDSPALAHSAQLTPRDSQVCSFTEGRAGLCFGSLAGLACMLASTDQTTRAIA